MLKKTITFVDYNDETRTETYYFNLSKTECSDFEFSTAGGLSAHLKKIVACRDEVQIYSMFKEIVAKAYGEKSADGKYFRKKAPDGHRLFDDFEATPAFDVLFIELITNEDTMSSFVNAVIPKDLVPSESDIVSFNQQLN